MKDEERLLYYLWLCQSCGHDPSVIYRLLNRYETPREAFEAGQKDNGFFALLQKNRQGKDALDGAKRLLERCFKLGIQVFDIEDSRYPEQLRHVTKPPVVLYAKGRMPDLNRMLGVSIVGTRHCTEDGEEMAEMMGRTLAKNGVTIISGMAQGIDGAAHCGALEAGGTTIAVLAGGVDLVYPPQHDRLYHHILNHGAVLSERPPGVSGKGEFYKQRNRIIVGLSYGTMIVEGDVKSGTSLSARLATENNRDIFAVPGNPMNKAATLPNELIRDGAKQVTHPMDVLEEYLELYPQNLEYGLSLINRPVVGKVLDLNHVPIKTKRSQKEEKKDDSEEIRKCVETMLAEGDFKEEEKKILQFLSEHRNTVSYDKIADACQLPANVLSSTLIILQMKKLVLQRAGGQYRLQIFNRATEENK